jgi:hypothetical protein
MELVLLHQRAFAPTTKRTNKLLGAAIKYAGLRGTEVREIGKNHHSTFGEEGTAP